MANEKSKPLPQVEELPSVEKIVEAAVKAALEAKGTQQNDLSQLAQVIADSTKAAIDTANPRAMTPQQRKDRGLGRTIYTAPKGKAKKLDAEFFQNHCPMNIKVLTFDECEALNVLATDRVPAGKYCDKFITVEKHDNGIDRQKVNITYPDKNQTDRLNQKSIGAKLKQFLEAIITDADKQKVERLRDLKRRVAEAEAQQD